jgi:hypothetical protein
VCGKEPETIVMVPVTRPSAAPRVFEIRTYTASPGKLEALAARFRNDTLRVFDKHGMTSSDTGYPRTRPVQRTR